MTNTSLPDDIYDQVTALSDRGNDLMDAEEFAEAVECFRKALELLPQPVTDWEAATWLYGSIGDAYFSLGEFEQSRNAFWDSANCPDGAANPFINLRLGECSLELGDLTRAREYLLLAYMSEGEEIFADEDPKYLGLLRETGSI